MKKYVILLFNLINAVFAFAQLSPVWTTQAGIDGSHVFFHDDKVYAIWLDENIVTSYMSVLNAQNGNKVDEVEIQSLAYVESSHFDKDSAFLYLAGLSESFDTINIVKTKLDGTVLWRKGIKKEGFTYTTPYSIVQAGDSLLIGFSVFDLSQGQITSAFGYQIISTSGSLIYDAPLFVFPPQLAPIATYATVFDAQRNVYAGATILSDFRGSLFKFDGKTHQLLWETEFADTEISSIHVGPDGGIWLAGVLNNNLKKVAPGNGELLLDFPLESSGFFSIPTLIANDSLLLALGSFANNEEMLNERIFVGAYSLSSGEPEWTFKFSIPGEVNIRTTSAVLEGDSALYTQNYVSGSVDYISKFRLGLVSTNSFLPKVEDFLLFPNPAKNYFYIQFPDTYSLNNAMVQVADVSGKVLLEAPLQHNHPYWLEATGTLWVTIKTTGWTITKKLLLTP